MFSEAFQNNYLKKLAGKYLLLKRKRNKVLFSQELLEKSTYPMSSKSRENRRFYRDLSCRLIVRFIAIKSTNLMNFDGFCRFCFADFCNEVVIYRYYQKNRRLIAINLPFLIEIVINR